MLCVFNMIIDFSKSDRSHSPTVIIGQAVEEVTQCKYLGTIMDSGLNFEANCEAVCKRGRQRLYCLRKRAVFNDVIMLTNFRVSVLACVY